MSLIRNIAEKAYSFLGWKTTRKLFVITSDDWGSVRIESQQNRKNLQQQGFSMDGNRFNRFDMLESDEDLHQLFETLRKFNDYKGNHPIVTALTNVANPDFDSIEASNYKEYFFEPFSETLKRYPAHQNVLDLYREGIQSNIFVPEFHGREHLHIKRWMFSLQNNEVQTMKAFNEKFYALDRQDLPLNSKGYGTAFDLDAKDEILAQAEIISSGLELFESLFGYRGTLFTAPSLVFNTSLETTLSKNGIALVDAPKIQKMPQGNGNKETRINYIGKKTTAQNQFYITRNAVFEPNISTGEEAINSCLRDITQAFNCGKPVIVSNHRAAFVGGIDPQNRRDGLKALEKLLEEVLKRWPEVEFVSAKELHKIMSNDL